MRSVVRNPEARVVAVVVCALLACEAGMRLYGDRLSKDIEHLEQFDEIAARAAAPSPTDVTRVLFLGNSLTRYGLRAEQFEAAARDVGRTVRVEKMTPDNTALADWYYAYRTFFHAAGRSPDLLVIGFADGHLRDAPSNHPERLAQYYCRVEDLPELFARDLPTVEDRAHYGAACGSALLCNRDRIERRVLDALIPGYREGIQTLNDRVRQSLPTRSGTVSYSRLRELLQLTREDGVQVVLAAMPIPNAYAIDPELQALAVETGTPLIDCRAVPGVEPAMFPDGLHMNEEAATRYTHYLAAALVTRQPPPRALGQSEPPAHVVR